MPYIITPSSNGWGNWKELAERAKLIVAPEQLALGDKLLARNPCERVEEERFEIENPLISREPATFFFDYWGARVGYKTLHPLPTLAAFAAWEGEIPESCWNLASPHILTDGEGGNFILCICGDVNGAYPMNRLRFLPTSEHVFRPAFVVGLEPGCAAARTWTKRLN